jgi:DNA repair exonuclease SbcCD ATPase subunit
MELSFLPFTPVLVTLAGILGTFFVKPGFWRQFRESRRELARERRSLAEWKGLFHGMTENERALAETRERLGKAKEEARKAGREVDFVTLSIEAVYESRNSEVDLEAVMSSMAQEEEKLLYDLRSAPNFMLLFGMLGTAVGLLLVAWQGKTQGTTQEIFRFAVGAFSATLVGIFTSVFGAFRVQSLGKEQNEMLAETQHFILSQVAPKLLPPKPETVVADLRAVVEASQRLLKKIPEALSTATEEFRNTLGEAQKGLQEVLHDLNVVANSVSYSAQEVGAGAQAVRDGLQEVRRSAEELRKFHDELQEVYRNLHSEFEVSRQRLDEASDRNIASLHDASEGIIKGFEEQGGKILQAVQEVYRNLHSEFEVSRQRLDEASDRNIASLHDASEGIIKGFEEQGGKILQAVQEVFRDFTDLSLKLNGASETLRENISALGGIKEEVRSGFNQLHSGLQHRLEDILERTKGVLQEYHHKVENLEGALRDGLGRVTERLDELAKRLDPRLLPESDWKTVVEALQALREVKDSLGSLLEDLKKELREFGQRIPAFQAVPGDGVASLGRVPQLLEETNNLLKSTNELIRKMANREEMGRGENRMGEIRASLPGAGTQNPRRGGRKKPWWGRLWPWGR